MTSTSDMMDVRPRHLGWFDPSHRRVTASPTTARHCRRGHAADGDERENAVAVGIAWGSGLPRDAAPLHPVMLHLSCFDQAWKSAALPATGRGRWNLHSGAGPIWYRTR